MRPAGGALEVVGSGIRPGLQTTPEARALIESADRVFCLFNDPLGEGWLRAFRPDAESLASCYRDGAPRLDAYAAMVERILGAVRAGERVTAVFYGHPGIFVRPAHEAVRRARAEGFPAAMHAAVSAEDLLFAEVGFDPAERGCQSHEATGFLLEDRHFDPCSSLVLWQVGVIGEDRCRRSGYRSHGAALLVEVLLQRYPETHEVVLYEANELPLGAARITRIPLRDLAAEELTARTTLWVPPLGARPRNPERARRLADLLRGS